MGTPKEKKMDEEIERLVVSVRADTAVFARDVAEMRGQLQGPLAAGVDQAGRAIENALVRAVRTGKLGFEDLKRVALQAMADIAASAIRGGLDALLGGGGKADWAAGSGNCSAGCWGRQGERRAGRWRPGAPIASASAGRSCSFRLRAGGWKRAVAAAGATSA